MPTKSYAHCFVGPEPAPLKAGDPRVLINGLPCRMDYRVISEGNYQRIMAIVDASGQVIDECDSDTRPTDGDAVQHAAPLASSAGRQASPGHTIPTDTPRR